MTPLTWLYPVPEFAFIVTKPLQLLFAVSIIRQLGAASRATVIITDSFSDAEGVSRRLATIDWDMSALEIRFCPDRSKAELLATQLNARQIFVDGDVGVRRFLILLQTQMRLRRPEIWVYEEGIGTYRTDLYGQTKRQFLGLFGVGTRFGGCMFTKGMYVMQPALYQSRFPQNRKMLVEVIASPAETISRDFDSWCHIFAYAPVASPVSDTCAIYLSNWVIEEQALAHLMATTGDKFIKPHPNIRQDISISGVVTLTGGAPAELILTELRQKYRRMTVYHRGSSTAC